MKSLVYLPGKELHQLKAFAEIRILVFGFVLSLAWEVFQSPFYADTFEASGVTLVYNRVHCSAGDALILLFAFWIVALIWGRSWMSNVKWVSYIAFMAIGVVYTVFSEYLNVYLLEGWAYSYWMPMVAGIGLVPVLQWVVVPTFVVRLYES
ncbi:MAG: hypothetical protein O7B35_08815 [Deltaproteobacteria bacterium]|nr:hypothetical protein [Deltaproteobacteria bacterium]